MQPVGESMSKNRVIAVGSDAERVDLCFCWRYLGQPVPAGTRIDLCCSGCNHRVCADPHTVRFHERGAIVRCNKCLCLCQVSTD